MRHVKSVIVVLFLSVAWPSSCYAVEPQIKFHEGAYRMGGDCVELIILGQDTTDVCASNLRVSVKRYDMPEFIFSSAATGEKLSFVSASEADFSPNNLIATYPISMAMAMDIESGMKYDVIGECVRSILPPEIISCQVWREPKGVEPIYAA